MNEIFSIAISIVAALFLYYLFMSLFIYLVELKDYNTKYRIISTRNEFIVQHSLFGLIWTTEQVCIGHTAISEDEFSYDSTLSHQLFCKRFMTGKLTFLELSDIDIPKEEENDERGLQ